MIKITGAYKGAFDQMIKLRYIHHKKAGILRPARPNKSAKMIKLIMTNKLDFTFGLPDYALDDLLKKAVEDAIEEKKIRGLPIAKYDLENKKAYIQLQDGSKVYI